jgi:hypothetical protein
VRPGDHRVSPSTPFRRFAIAAAVALGLAACGNGTVNQRADAFVERPVIDPGPYYTACTMSNDTCPDPYECTVPDLSHDPMGDVCLVPCSSDRDCPAGNFCNGPDRLEDVGASNHCANDI